MHRRASRWLAAALPALTLSAGSAAADPAVHRHVEDHRGGYVVYAEVVDVSPRYGWTEVSEPVRRCEDVAAGPDRYARHYDHLRRYDDRRGHPRDSRGNVAAGLVGGLIGGLVGNQFGGGDGRKALTVVGALVGASIAQDHVRSSSRESRDYHDAARSYGGAYDGIHRVVRRCSESIERREVRGIQGYDVTYRYQGRTFDKWMDEHPGERVRIHVEVEPADELAAR